MPDQSNVVELQRVEKSYGAVTAVHALDLAVETGAFVTLLGPSGCGKTTTLRMIAGLEIPTAGDIFIKSERVNDVPIHKRNLGLVFQNYALFPHKTIFDNVAFGLRYRDVPKSEIAGRVSTALDLVQLPQVADRYPSQLSGGQQQRIALARAIVIQPDVLLLDEPLSALDANLREEMRVELKRIQHRLGVSTVFVTHDQSEALAMSDLIVVMSEGRIEQFGSPEEVYRRPVSEFVATFLGHSNILEARVAEQSGSGVRVEVDGLGSLLAEAPQSGLASNGSVRIVLRAENIRLVPKGNGSVHAPDGVATLSGSVTTVDYQGQVARYFLDVGQHSLQAINPIDGHPFAEGADLSIQVRAQDVILLPADGVAQR